MPPVKILDEINAPNVAIKNRVVEAFSGAYGRPDNVADPTNPSIAIPNPQSKEDFMREILLKFVRDVTADYEGNSAADAAKKLARDKAKNEVIPT